MANAFLSNLGTPDFRNILGEHGIVSPSSALFLHIYLP